MKKPILVDLILFSLFLKQFRLGASTVSWSKLLHEILLFLVPWRLGAPWQLQRTPPFVSIKTLLLAVWPSFPWMDSASPTINSPVQQMNGSPQGSIWQTWPQYRRRLVASFWTMFSWTSSVVLMSMFRLWSFISDDSSNYSEAVNFKHAQLSLSIAVTVQVSADYP